MDSTGNVIEWPSKSLGLNSIREMEKSENGYVSSDGPYLTWKS